jgi:hypothetical protein
MSISEGVFKFSVMQSQIAQELIAKHQAKKVVRDTFFLIKY